MAIFEEKKCIVCDGKGYINGLGECSNCNGDGVVTIFNGLAKARINQSSYGIIKINKLNDKDRASGRTTRIIDEAIQTLLTKKLVRFKDHVDYTGLRELRIKSMAYRILHIVIRRLEQEHGFNSSYRGTIHSHIYLDGTIEITINEYDHRNRMKKLLGSVNEL